MRGKDRNSKRWCKRDHVVNEWRQWWSGGGTHWRFMIRSPSGSCLVEINSWSFELLPLWISTSHSGVRTSDSHSYFRRESVRWTSDQQSSSSSAINQRRKTMMMYSTFWRNNNNDALSDHFPVNKCVWNTQDWSLHATTHLSLLTSDQAESYSKKTSWSCWSDWPPERKKDWLRLEYSRGESGKEKINPAGNMGQADRMIRGAQSIYCQIEMRVGDIIMNIRETRTQLSDSADAKQIRNIPASKIWWLCMSWLWNWLSSFSSWWYLIIIMLRAEEGERSRSWQEGRICIRDKRGDEMVHPDNNNIINKDRRWRDGEMALKWWKLHQRVFFHGSTSSHLLTDDAREKILRDWELLETILENGILSKSWKWEPDTTTSSFSPGCWSVSLPPQTGSSFKTAASDGRKNKSGGRKRRVIVQRDQRNRHHQQTSVDRYDHQDDSRDHHLSPPKTITELEQAQRTMNGINCVRRILNQWSKKENENQFQRPFPLLPTWNIVIHLEQFVPEYNQYAMFSGELSARDRDQSTRRMDQNMISYFMSHFEPLTLG